MRSLTLILVFLAPILRAGNITENGVFTINNASEWGSNSGIYTTFGPSISFNASGSAGSIYTDPIFGTQYGAQVADIISKYTKYNGRRKPEMLAPDTYSLTDYAEARWIAGCERCREHLLQQCAQAGFAPRIAFTTDDYVAVQALSSSGRVLSVSPATARPNGRGQASTRAAPISR